MEVERNDSYRGIAGTGLGLGAAALGLVVAQSGILGPILNPSAAASQSGDNAPVNRYELSQAARIAELETEVKLRDANAYTLTEMGKLRDYVDRRIERVEHELCDQKVINAQTIGNMTCMAGQINQLYALTKLVVPNSAICPGWGDVTVAITPTTTAAG